jgi:hypothetical protein
VQRNAARIAGAWPLKGTARFGLPHR